LFFSVSAITEIAQKTESTGLAGHGPLFTE